MVFHILSKCLFFKILNQCRYSHWRNHTETHTHTHIQIYTIAPDWGNIKSGLEHTYTHTLPLVKLNIQNDTAAHSTASMSYTKHLGFKFTDRRHRSVLSKRNVKHILSCLSGLQSYIKTVLHHWRAARCGGQYD